MRIFLYISDVYCDKKKDTKERVGLSPVPTPQLCE